MMRKRVAEKHLDFCLDDSWGNPVFFSAPSFNCSLGRTSENVLLGHVLILGINF